MCPSAPRVCNELDGQKPVLSLSLDRIRRIIQGHISALVVLNSYLYSFVIFFTSYSLLCIQFILYHFLYHSVLVVVRDRWHVELRDILHQLLATLPPVHIVSFPLSFCIGCSQRSLTCRASWHSSSVTRYCASSSYCIISFIILYWLQSEIADMYSFVTFFISYSLLCLQFILAFIRDFQADALDPDEEEEERRPLLSSSDMMERPEEEEEEGLHKVQYWDPALV